jgi:hypothetical protein
VARMPGPPALVTMAKRLPLGNGWRESPTAKSFESFEGLA